jgi:hypothetical protein
MKLHLAVVTALLALASSAFAQSPTPAELERGLAGRWSGALEYRDYQSERRLQIPVQTELRVASDGATLQRESRFDDGPARGTVLITTVGLYDEAGSVLTSASFRRGRPVESFSENARVERHDSATRWRASWLRRGLDGGQEMEIRVTVTREGDTLSSVKEVRPPGAPDSAWAFRNQTLLTRLP